MLEYKGKGNFVVGIPARDISDKEIKNDCIDVKRVLRSGLYKERKPKAADKASTGPKENKGG